MPEENLALSFGRVGMRIRVRLAQLEVGLNVDEGPGPDGAKVAVRCFIKGEDVVPRRVGLRTGTCGTRSSTRHI